MSVTVAELRQRVAAGVGTALGSGWRESVYVADLLRDGGAGGNVFSVEPVETEWIQGARTNVTHPSEPGRVRTFFAVRLRWRLAVDAAPSSLDALLDAERSMVGGLPSINWDEAGGPLLGTINRSVSADGAFIISTLRFSVTHTFGA